MVWALNFPSVFGRFTPEGEFTDLKSRLENHFNDVMSDDERAAYKNWIVDYEYKTAQKFKKDLGLLAEHERPTEFVAKKHYKTLGSIIQPSGILLVSEGLKKLLEELEPEVHQFWELKIFVRDAHDWQYTILHPEKYYGINIRRYLDSFCRENTDPASLESSTSVPYLRQPFEDRATKVAMSTSVIGVSHLWREKALRGPEIYLSDTLHSEMKQRKMSSPKQFRLKEF